MKDGVQIPMSAAEGELKKARVLCLHGHGQDGGTFRARTGALRKALSSVAELTYADAPHVIRDAQGNVSGRAWWHIPCGTGREESVEHLKSVLSHNVCILNYVYKPFKQYLQPRLLYKAF